MNFFIQFENSDMVSIDNNKDTLVIIVKDVSFFTMIDEASVLEEGTIVTMKIPKQLSEEISKESLEAAKDALRQTTNTLVISQVVATIFLSISLKQMWNLIGILQILVFLRAFTNWPAYTNLVLKYLHNAIYLRDISDHVFNYGMD